jgi:hypothetical protein
MAKKASKPRVYHCKACGAETDNILKHRWDEHRSDMEAITAVADSRNPYRQNAKKKDPTTIPTTDGGKDGQKATSVAVAGLRESTFTEVSPRTFRMNSAMIWQAREAAINEWGWPTDMTPEEFLDTYLYISFKQRGIILGGYTVLSPSRDGDDDNGDGRGEL